MTGRSGQPPFRAGKVRAARLTDLAALGELSRLAQAEDSGARSLGLPLAGPPIGVFTLFRLPLGAFRPHDMLYVHEQDGRLAGLLRIERDGHRDEWTIVELDAVGHGDAGDIRYRLVQACLRDVAKRGATRFHVACADEDGNVELFMQAGFARYGEEVICFRGPDRPLPTPLTEAEAGDLGIRPVGQTDAVALFRLYSAVTPAPVQRLEMNRIADWELHGSGSLMPRSSLTPILRFADVESFLQEAPAGEVDPTAAIGFVQVGVAKEDQPHYLRVLVRPGADAGPLVRFGLGVIAARTERGDHRHDHGVIAPVRTYESPLEHRLEEEGFGTIATVTLLMKETLVRVAEPAMVPAVR
ncbi:MAG TPA: hypothetical protein VER83_04040 [Candidatus Nanopelagicales bacterium]|nr:hypothetical protein [Candidatus Nanopelagicales bacterium]